MLHARESANKKEAFSVLLVVKRALAKTHYEPGVERIYRQ